MTAAKLPSERSFGALFVAVFAGLAAYGVYRNWDRLLITLAGIASATLLLVTLVAPGALAPLNKAWFQFGLLLGRIVSPIVVGILFFALITPVAVATRLLKRDALHLKRQRIGSYWINRQPPGPASDSFKNQF